MGRMGWAIPDSLGLLVLAYGTPESLEEVEAYYTHIRRGRPPSPQALAELIERYRAIGGKSPLTEITFRQARGIAERLQNRLGRPVLSYVGMKHAPPFIAETVRNMSQEAAVNEAVVLVMTPQYAGMSVGSYRRAVEDAAIAAGSRIRFSFVDHWHLHPGFIQALATRVRAANNRLPEAVRHRSRVIFTAHSLPARIAERGDPYARHLRETAHAVAQAADLADAWEIAFQSAGRTDDAWLGPDICDRIPELAQEGVLGVVVCPAGFVADHLEVLYDLDIEAKQVAVEAGLSFQRTESLNDSPDFLEALCDVAASQVEGAHP